MEGVDAVVEFEVVVVGVAVFAIGTEAGDDIDRP